MLSLERIIQELKQLTEQTIPLLSRDIGHHSNLISEKHSAIENITASGIHAPVDNKSYAFHHLALVKAIYDARLTISETFRVSTFISQLAKMLTDLNTTNIEAKKLIQKQVDFCDKIIEDIDQFTDNVNESMKLFGSICSLNRTFIGNINSLRGEINDPHFNTWCEYWMNTRKRSRSTYDNPLEEAIKLIPLQPIQAPLVQASVS